ncbi:hypothetical protein ACOSZF_20445 [Cytobacillus firmus]|uniref:hypothetical protein n=1 Tax=Cytobacillus firmus TaxID=1399 RepID=UPI003BA190C8
MTTLVDGIKSMASAPFKAIKSALAKARELLPFSDAKTGPFSQLTHNGGKIMSTLAEGVYNQTGALHRSMNQAFAGAPGLTAGYDFSNDSGYGTGSSVKLGSVPVSGSTMNKSNVSRNTVLKIEKGAIQINSTDGRSNEELGQFIMEYLYDRLSQAEEILSSADMGRLLD